MVSGPRGLALLRECLTGPLSRYVRVVAVFTDKPNCPPNGDVRFWRYSCFDTYRHAVVQLMIRLEYSSQIPLLVDSISPSVVAEVRGYLSYFDQMRLTGMVCGYGCLIKDDVFGQFPGGVYNSHPSAIARAVVDLDGSLPNLHPLSGEETPTLEVEPLAQSADADGPVYTVHGNLLGQDVVQENEMIEPFWPSEFRGPQPWENMMLFRRGMSDAGDLPLLATIVIHKIDTASWDLGQLLAWSSWFPVIQSCASLPLKRRGSRYVETESSSNHELLGRYVLSMHIHAVEPTLDVCRTFLRYLADRSAERFSRIGVIRR